MTEERKEKREGMRLHCPQCRRAITVFVRPLRASCTKCGRKLLPGEPAQKQATA